jgi:hypothetical protein
MTEHGAGNFGPAIARRDDKQCPVLRMRPCTSQGILARRATVSLGNVLAIHVDRTA